MKSNIRKAMIYVSLIGFIIVCMLSAEADLKYVFANIVNGTAAPNQKNIIFSKDSGFYDESFELHIYAPTKDIYYTLDGSDPDENSLKYEKGIIVEDATNQPNVYSMRTDVTAEFQDEIIEKYCNNRNIMNYTVPEYNVDKCTVIKAVYYDKNGVRSDIEERVYFVGFDEKSGYEDVGVISLVSDPENLFGYEEGIYVLGATYDEFLKTGLLDDEEWGPREYWAQWNTNYSNRGIDWERECTISVFDEEKEFVLSQNAGVRIQGGGSRGFLPKSLNFYARDEYGSNRFYYDFWGTGYYPKRMTLTAGGDDFNTKIKDRLVSELTADCNFVTMNYKPYILFLNGEYWGFYYLTEKYDEQYIENYYGVDKGESGTDIIIIKSGLMETGRLEDEELYTQMVETIVGLDMQKEENYKKACELIDMESFIDYHAALAYVARCGDWPWGNFQLWRSRNISDKPYEDGKWRWMLFDVNSTAMEDGLEDFDSIAHMREASELFNSLYDNASFREEFHSRLLELADTIYSEKNVNQKLEEYVQLMEIPMENHHKRFFSESNERFLEGIDEIRCFFEKRREYVLESMENSL